MADSQAVRAEDAFDVSTVHGWLAGRVDGLPAEPPEVTQFAGGASNLTYQLRYPGRDLILRRPPAGRKASGAHDMAREYRIQKGLAPVYPYVPAVLALCQDEAVIGGDFYVMERIPGTILRRRLPAGLTLDADQGRVLSETFVDKLVELHQVDPAATGLADLGKGAGYVHRQVTGWTKRYRQARTWNVPRFESVMDWLAEHEPADVGTCVIHNDFRLDNIVLAPDDSPNDETLTVVGVLDWELATIGDPLMDLGTSLAYWVQADDDRLFQANRRQPSNLPGMLTRRQIVERYCAAMGLSAENWAFYEVFGLFRLAAIAQQIYYRYHHKQTRNPTFRWFWVMVGYLGWRCGRIIAAQGH
ncbi:MAG TPA: phosphotransferase family protein [Pseudonocardiaceae bacterium]|nr:phosphotransferase family protein [Pseudonocardiaceae bacterium]